MTCPFSESQARLLKSGLAALPVQGGDFHEIWSSGLGIDAPAVALALQRRGPLLGFAGEPNPGHPALSESLADTETPGIVRWRFEKMASVIGSNAGEEGRFASSLAWFKAGLAVPLSELADEDAMAPETDRTLLVRNDEPFKLDDLTPEEVRVFESASQPLPFSQGLSPWRIIGEAAGVEPVDARAAVLRLLITRRWRRFALRLDPAASGWAGCGLAGWSIPAESAERAAAALAGIQSTGDVCLREPTEPFPFNLTALVRGRGPGEGRATAERISGKWGVSRGAWLPLLT